MRALNGMDITPSSSGTFQFHAASADNVPVTVWEKVAPTDLGSPESPAAPDTQRYAAVPQPVQTSSISEVGAISEQPGGTPFTPTPSYDSSEPIVTSNDPVVEERVIESVQEVTVAREQVVPPTGIPEADSGDAKPTRSEPARSERRAPDAPPAERSVQRPTDDPLQGDASSSPTEPDAATVTPIESQELDSVEPVDTVINEQVGTVGSGIDAAAVRRDRPPVTESARLQPNAPDRLTDVPVQSVQKPVRSQAERQSRRESDTVDVFQAGRRTSRS